MTYLINDSHFQPLSAITNRSKTDGSTITSSLSDSDTSGAKSAASGKDVAFVFITADSGEDYITVEGTSLEELL